MASSVKQWLTSLDGLDKLRQTVAPMPSPGPGQVLVEVHAVSLNYRDIEVAMGAYTHHRSVTQTQSVVPCSDMCGVVVQVGSGVTAWQVGDRVLSIFLPGHQTGQVTERELSAGLGLPEPGVLTTHRLFADYALVRAPGYLTDQEASCLPVASVTAWMSINGVRPPGKSDAQGEYVLVQGTGGVSIAGLQIAKAAGAKVIVTSSSDDKLGQAKQLGADVLVNYVTNPDWQDVVMEATGGHGADIILEVGGAGTLQKSFECVAFGGLINCIGYVSGKTDGPDDRTNINVLALRRTVTLKGILNGPKDQFEDMLRFYEQHRIHPVVNRVFEFDAAVEAFEFLRSGGHFGKVVIQVNH